MYQVSQAFKDKIKEPIQEHRLTGTIGNQSFSEDNIVEGSFTINNQSTDTSDVVLGSCYVGQLTAEFTGIDIAYGNWINKTITPSFGLKVGEYYEYVPLGVYKIKEAKHTDRGVQVTAYDNMIKFDKKFRKSHYMNLAGMWNIISQLCTDAGVTLGMTQAQIEALPNGDRTGINIYGSTGKKSEFANDIITLRDALFWVAQTLGCFVTVNRAGQVEFRQYTQNVVDVIASTDRIEGATFADYITHYVGIYVENLDDNTEDYYGHDVTALQQELTETMGEITQDQEDITDLEADRTEWTQKLANHECTQEEYDAAIAEIDAQEKVLSKEIKQLTKRAEWLSNAIAQSADDGSDMVLGANPLVMAKNLTTRDQQRREILTALDDISYTPFNASVICGAHYDLGDVIQFSGGLYNSETDSFGCVMSWNYTHNGGTELEGFGVDPAVVVIRNKNAKNTKAAKDDARIVNTETNERIDALPTVSNGTDQPTGGKQGDMYVKYERPQKADIVTKKVYGWKAPAYVQTTASTWYCYDEIEVTCDSGNFVLVAYDLVGQSVTGDVTRNNFYAVAVCKIPYGSSKVPQFTWTTSNIQKFNAPPPSPFQQSDPDSLGQSIGYFSNHVDGKAKEYTYYWLPLYTSGTWFGSLRNEESPYDYYFPNYTINDILENDMIEIPDYYEGEYDTQLQFYADNQWNPYVHKVKQAADVTIDNPSDGQTLVYDPVESKWKNGDINTMTGATSQADGSKGLVPAPTMSDGDKFLKGDGTWGEPQGASAVSDLTDVELDNLSDGQILKYNNDTQKWENADESGGGGGSVEMLAPTPFIYSENEEQVGIWIDGKPLYQKTVIVQPMALSSGVTINHGISNIDKVVYYKAIMDRNSNNSFIDFTYATGAGKAGSFRVFKTYIEYNGTDSWTGSEYSAIYVTVQYTKTTDTSWQGGFKAYGFTPVIYSDEEREIGVWRDGKPLYEKTIKSTTTPSASAWNQIALPTGISVKTYCGYYRRSTGAINKLSAYREDSNPAEMLFDSITNSTYYYRISSAFIANFSEIDIIIQYTKDSDTAGSGKYTTLGVPAVHYDDTERIVGTWFGETLWQKTIDVNVSVNALNTWFYTGVTITNASKCIKAFALDSSGQSHAASGAFSQTKEVAVAFGSIATSGTRVMKKITLQYTKTS